MEASLGKSSYYSHFNPLTLKYHTRAAIECIITNEK